MSLGIGVACTTSVGPRFTLAVEAQCLGQSLVRRLSTPRGYLSWAPNDGIDVREFLNKGDTQQNRFAAIAAIKDECEKDERVQAASVAVSFNFATSTLTITIDVETADGPFTFVIAADKVTVELLESS